LLAKSTKKLPLEKLIGFLTMMGKPFTKHEANVIMNWILTPTTRGVSSHYGLAIYIKKAS